MADRSWNWAKLSDEQLRLLKDAERTLGADILLAFQSGGEAGNTDRQLPSLQAADLNESQVECLRGTEDRLASVVVAYKHAAK